MTQKPDVSVGTFFRDEPIVPLMLAGVVVAMLFPVAALFTRLWMVGLLFMFVVPVVFGSFMRTFYLSWRVAILTTHRREAEREERLRREHRERVERENRMWEARGRGFYYENPPSQRTGSGQPPKTEAQRKREREDRQRRDYERMMREREEMQRRIEEMLRGMGGFGGAGYSTAGFAAPSRPRWTYFGDCNTFDEAKAKHKKLVMKHHPDRGGNTRDMAEINAEWDKVQEYFNNRR